MKSVICKEQCTTFVTTQYPLEPAEKVYVIERLWFIQFKIDTTCMDTVMKLYLAFYSDKDIETSTKLLFDL